MERSEPAGPVAAWRFLVPNLFTAASACLGLSAILLAMMGSPVWASWCVLWCVLLDKLDGTAARLLGSTSLFGRQFDSFADLIAFGLAPAVLVFSAGRQVWALAEGSLAWWLWALGCGLYALMATIRLARFNADCDGAPVRTFCGVPSTLCGAIVPAALLVALEYRIDFELARYFPALMVVLGLGMVSRVPVPKVVRRRNRAFDAFQWINVVAAYVCGILMLLPEYLLGLGVFYLLVGAGHGLLRGAARPATGTPSAER